MTTEKAPAWHSEYLDHLESISDLALAAEHQSYVIRRLDKERERLLADPLVECRNAWASKTRRISEWDEIADKMDALLTSVGAGRIARPWFTAIKRAPSKPQTVAPTLHSNGTQL
jgi:hypothetical protein